MGLLCRMDIIMLIYVYLHCYRKIHLPVCLYCSFKSKFRVAECWLHFNPCFALWEQFPFAKSVGLSYPRWMLQNRVIGVKAQLPGRVSHVVSICFVLHLPSRSLQWKGKEKTCENSQPACCAHGDHEITREESYSIFEHERLVNYKEMIEQCPLQFISGLFLQRWWF